MRDQDDGEVVIDCQTAQQSDELACLGAGILFTAEHVGERVENYETRLGPLRQGDEAAKHRCRG